MRVKIIGGPWPQAIGKIGKVVNDNHDNECYWVEFDNIRFDDGIVGEVNWPNRSYFFANEVEVK